MKSSVEVVFKFVGYLKVCDLESILTHCLRSVCVLVFGGLGTEDIMGHQRTQNSSQASPYSVQTVTGSWRFPKDSYIFALFLCKKSGRDEDPTCEQITQAGKVKRNGDWNPPVPHISWPFIKKCAIMYLLTMELCSEKCVLRWSHHCANIIKYINTNLDGIAATHLGYMVYHCHTWSLTEMSLCSTWL